MKDPERPAVLSNLFHPWILARLATAIAAAVLVGVGLATGARVLRFAHVEKTNEGRLAIERRAELVSALLVVALAGSALGLVLAVLGADRMAGSIRGAMCAWGVLDASPFGFPSLGASIVATLVTSAWLGLHRVDLALARPALTRLKFGALYAVAPFVFLDLALAMAFALDLDLRAHASCCSLGLDETRAAVMGARGGPRELSALIFVVAGLGASALAFWTSRRPTRVLALSAALASSLAAAAALPAIALWVAPHAYGTPAHMCPFCLLHADVLGVGWPLFVGVIAGAALGTCIAVAVAVEHKSGEPAAVRGVLRSMARGASAAWALALVAALAPVIRWALETGGAPLFGA